MTADTLAVVVRWRGGDEVRACLRSLLDHGGPRLAGVVLVDSGSGDGFAARLADEFSSIRVVALENNLGFAHAANRGAAVGDEPRLLLLNPDTEMLPDSLEQLASGLDEDPGISGAVPLLVGAGGASQHQWQLRRLPSVIRLSSGRSGAPAFSSVPTEPQPVQQPAAAAWLVRRSVWETLDGLDEDFAPAWWEDVDFCARLEAGVRDPGFPTRRGFVVQPKATIFHRGGSSVASLGDEAFLTAYYRNLVRFVDRHHGRFAPGILAALRLTLRIKAITQPRRRHAYLAALKVVSNRPRSAAP